MTFKKAFLFGLKDLGLMIYWMGFVSNIIHIDLMFF